MLSIKSLSWSSLHGGYFANTFKMVSMDNNLVLLKRGPLNCFLPRKPQALLLSLRRSTHCHPSISLPHLVQLALQNIRLNFLLLSRHFFLQNTSVRYLGLFPKVELNSLPFLILLKATFLRCFARTRLWISYTVSTHCDNRSFFGFVRMKLNCTEQSNLLCRIT